MSSERRPFIPTLRSSPEVVTIARSALPLASGDRLAERFILREHYGSGPLGHTYRAEDRQQEGAPVAIKVFSHELVPTPAERATVVHEIERLVEMRRVDGVALPIATGESDGVAWVASPWVPGRSLRRVLGAYRDAGKDLPAEEIVGVLDGVVKALRSLHASTSHGAVYPENVQVTFDGKVVLTDAGLTGSIKRGRVVDHYEKFSDVMPYLSPDVRGGKPPSAGSDLYALGALACELLTGDPAAAAAGIAGPMLRTRGYPAEVEKALMELASLRSAARAAALPSLMAVLLKHVAARTLPTTTALPSRQQRTDVLPVVVPPKVPRPRKR